MVRKSGGAGRFAAGLRGAWLAVLLALPTLLPLAVGAAPNRLTAVAPAVVAAPASTSESGDGGPGTPLTRAAPAATAPALQVLASRGLEFRALDALPQVKEERQPSLFAL